MSAFYVAYEYGSWVLLPIIALAAWMVGGKPERAAATMYLVAMAATPSLRSAAAYIHPETWVFGIDFALLCGLIWLALTADRFWPLPSAAFQGLACLAHLQKFIEPHSYTLGYQLLAEASTYPTLILLAIGVWREWLRSRKSIKKL